MQTLVPLSAPKLAHENHPYFVGLALLRSLLVHEDVARDEGKMNAVLDVIGLLLRQAPALHVVRAFCQMRRICGPVCYLALYRLRRWVEGQVMVKVGGKEWQQLELKFTDFRRLQQDLCRAEWETDLEIASPKQVMVTFCWRGVVSLEAECDALSLAEALEA